MRLFKRVGITVAAGALLGFILPSTVEAVTIVPGDAFCTADFSDLGQRKDSQLSWRAAGSRADEPARTRSAGPAGVTEGSLAGSYSTVFSGDGAGSVGCDYHLRLGAAGPNDCLPVVLRAREGRQLQDPG